MSAKPLQAEFDYYMANRAQIVAQYSGKVVVICGNSVVGHYETELEAIKESSDKYTPGTFFVQRCVPGQEDYTQLFHSRVRFD